MDLPQTALTLKILLSKLNFRIETPLFNSDFKDRVQACWGDQDKGGCKHHNPYGLD